METSESSRLASSLMQWVQSFSEDATSTYDWNSLTDGITLWNILKELDHEYFSGELPEPDVGSEGDWTRKWQNLRYVERQVTTYYRDICNGQDHVSASAPWMPDLQAIAAEGTIEDLEKLIMIIIRATMASPESNQRMAQRLMSLGREHAMIIATELRNMEEADYGEADTSSSRTVTPEPTDLPSMNTTPKANGEPLAPIAAYADPLLEREEELLQAQVTINQLQARHVEMQRQVHELRQDKEKLQEAFDLHRAEIEGKGRKATTNSGDDDLKKLQRQADNDRAYIDDLENQLTSNRDSIDRYEQQIENQRAESEAAQKLRDDLQILRAESEDMQQKLKANENLKKKIQALQEHEKANAALRDELKLANEKLEDADKLHQVRARLEKEIIEKQGLIRNQEYQINELLTTRKHVEYEAKVLEKKLEAARERHDRDHEAIEELQARLSENGIAGDNLNESTTTESKTKEPDPKDKAFVSKNDESKNLAEKLNLIEQQLVAADARLKQATQRNLVLEEQNQLHEALIAGQADTEERLSANEVTIAALRKELDIAMSKEPAAPAPAAPAPDILALQKENELMTAAWYNLAGRIQHSTVTLTRRKAEPKSWLAQQRALVGPKSGAQHSRR